MRRLFVELEYEGTNYHGWQVQPDALTIQQVLEDVLHRILGERVRMVAAGRTDAGVHAKGQVAHFLTHATMDCRSLLFAMNSLLPEDIAVRTVGDAVPDFHARRSALKKRYEYWIWNDRIPSVFSRRFSWHVRRPLNLQAMKQAASGIVGQRDFTSFQAAGCSAAGRSVRHVQLVEIRCVPQAFVRVAVEADAFLRHMVRILVGTLVEVGLGRFSAEEVPGLLEAKDRASAGRTAPARGLFLEWVRYPEGLLPGRDRASLARREEESPAGNQPFLGKRTDTGSCGLPVG